MDLQFFAYLLNSSHWVWEKQEQYNFHADEKYLSLGVQGAS